MRVLVIITTRLVEYGGIANAFMNYYKNMDLTDLIIDVVSCENHDDSMGKLIEHNEGTCFDVPSKQKKPLQYYKSIKKILGNKYDVIDVHGNSATMVMELWLAKRKGIPNRMAHCLNSKTSHLVIHRLMRPLFNHYCNNKTACTKEAAEFLYGNISECTVLRNTIPTEKYVFSNERRAKIRKKYAIDDETILIGTVGKINEQKNQMFLLEVISGLLSKHDNIVLMIVGDGPLRSTLEKRIAELNIEKQIVFAGMQNDVISFYSAFDIYVFPSLFEGESLALLEAKCSGVLGCVSSTIKLEDNDNIKTIIYEDLNIDAWEKTIDQFIECVNKVDREKTSLDAVCVLKEKGLDSKKESLKLRKLYFKRFR